MAASRKGGSMKMPETTPPAWSVHGDLVRIEIPRDTHSLLLLALGYAAGAAMKHGQNDLYRRFLQLANDINRGNPNYVPYEVRHENRST
jgi:hypothetical protein